MEERDIVNETLDGMEQPTQVVSKGEMATEEASAALDTAETAQSSSALESTADETTVISARASEDVVLDETTVIGTSDSHEVADNTTVIDSHAAAKSVQDEATVLAAKDDSEQSEAEEDSPAQTDGNDELAGSSSVESGAAAHSRRLREALASALPSFDDAAASQGTQVINDSETVVVTHTKLDATADEDEATEQALSSLVTVTEPTTPDEDMRSQTETLVSPQLSPEPITEGVQGYESPFAQDEQPKGGGKKIAKRIGIVVLAILAVLTIVYVGAGFYFTSHFLPNTSVNGEDVSGMSVSDLATYVNSIGENYKTTITGDGIDLTIPGSDISFVYDGDAYSKEAADQIDPWHWPMNISGTHDLVVNRAITFDQSKLEELVGEAVDKINEDASDPKNATMTYDEGSSKFVVVADELGTKVNRDAVTKLASESVATMKTEIKLGDAELVQPTVDRENEKLLKNINTTNEMLDKSVTLRIADKDATKLDRNLMASWLSLDDDTDISVDEDAIKEWAQSTLSEEFDTTGTKRSYTRPDGKEIEVEGGSADYDYGWCLDGEELSHVLGENMRNANTDPIDVPMKKSAATWNPGGQDWPNRYIDVDLSEQHVRMYDDSSEVIWESDCVSGNPIYGGGTDTGVFYIYMKSSPMELVGLDYDHDGQPDYRSWVTYWMPFDGGEGLHDMASRYAFGGNIYSYNGSHGCVNLPYSAAEQLWGLTEVGDCVVVHW